MKKVYIERKKIKKLKVEDVYPDGANSPTRVTTYKCFCKKGNIVEEDVVGFNDHIMYLECEKCEKKYSKYIYFSGSYLEAYLLEKEDMDDLDDSDELAKLDELIKLAEK